MKKAIWLGAVIFYCFIFAFCATAIAETVEKPFLWKIETKQPSYLFGTIHLPDERVTTLHPSVETAFAESEYVYTEIPLDTKDMLSQVKYLLLEGDTTLYDIVPADLIQRSEQQIKEINPALTIEPFAKFKVWALATSLPLLEQQLKNPGVMALDAQLYQRASNEGKGVGGIETMQEQMQYFEALSQKEEIKMLRDTIEFMEQADTDGTPIAEEFIKFYTQGDIEEFSDLMIKYVKEDEFSREFIQKILHDRNFIMADRIEKKLKKNPSRSYFFAVGAGHFGGDTGVQKLLMKKGFKIKRIEK